MKPLSFYGQSVIEQYGDARPWLNRLVIPFTSFSAANAISDTIPLIEATDDVLILELYVNFKAAGVGIIVADGEQYRWMQSSKDSQANFAPLPTVAGTIAETEPVERLPIEYLLKANRQLEFKFRNAGTSPQTADRILTVRGIRLRDKKGAK